DGLPDQKLTITVDEKSQTSVNRAEIPSDYKSMNILTGANLTFESQAEIKLDNACFGEAKKRNSSKSILYEPCCNCCYTTSNENEGSKFHIRVNDPLVFRLDRINTLEYKAGLTASYFSANEEVPGVFDQLLPGKSSELESTEKHDTILLR